MLRGAQRRVQRRDFRVDCLRGLSILSVLLLHFQIAYRLLNGPVGTLLPGPYLSNLAWNGNYGVVVFFVISGYLITSTSIRRFGGLGAMSPKVFYAFRLARILPCLVLVLAVIGALAMAGVTIFQDDGKVPLWLAEFSVLTFWHNVLMAKYGYFNYCLNIFWSLSVEEVFYLAFPLLCVLLRRTRWLALVWIAAVIAGPWYRSRNSHNEILFLYGYLACFDAIAMGCIAAVLARRVLLQKGWCDALQGLSLVWMTYIFLRAGIDSVPVWGPSCMALGAAVFLLAEGAVEPSEDRSNKVWLRRAVAPLGWFGRHSYELYLFHIVVLAGMMTVVKPKSVAPGSKPLWLMLFVGVSAGVAWGIARWYSEPMNRGLRAKLVDSMKLR